MVEEFDLPLEIIDRRVTKMKMISPSNREVDVGKTLSEREWIGMCRREVFDDFLRKRAAKNGAKVCRTRLPFGSGAAEHAHGDM
jgi:geranylgeranyl reductase